jgi:hypothetical protein
VHVRILGSLGDDYSDVFQLLAISFPLSGEAQFALQKQILYSGWLNYNTCMETFHQLSEYHIQAEWVERGYTVLPQSQKAFEERYRYSEGMLVIHGLDAEGQGRVLATDKLHIELDDDSDDGSGIPEFYFD